MFKKAKWIWINKENNKDEYGHFRSHILWDSGSVKLNISCDGNYSVFVNGKISNFGQYPDYPHYKVVQQADITTYLKRNDTNIIDIFVWHYGIENSQTYYPDEAGVIFEILNSEKVLDYSHSSTPAKLHDQFVSYREKMITRQLGLSFKYDNRITGKLFHDSYLIDKKHDFFNKPIDDLKLIGRLSSTLLYKRELSKVFDLGRQSIGFLDLEFYSPIDQEIVITFGENIEDNKINHIIHDRDFSVSYHAKKGYNRFTNYLLKLGCRYLQVYYEVLIDVDYIGLNEIEYPLELKKNTNLELSMTRQKIYDISIQTLKNCIFDHYVDSPWREQALYTLDSRNQMLCGYYAFEGYDYARANCVLISKGLRNDGLLDMCFPSKIELTIPLYSLVYPLQVYEYILHSRDQSILREVYPVLEKIIQTFESRIDSQNLIKNFEAPYWNFYEWSEGSHNGQEIHREELNNDKNPVYSLILNTYFLYVMKYFKILSDWMGKSYIFDEKPILKAIKKTFYDKKTGLYFLDNQSNLSSVLGNSMVILSDVTSSEEAQMLIKKMTGNSQLIPITLSMKCYFYDALLKTNKKYKSFILEDIDKDYGYMLEQGATTFWETIKGKEDFDGAGSLCHGWSAMPTYYYHKLLT